jgi:hypothetical protein
MIRALGLVLLLLCGSCADAGTTWNEAKRILNGPNTRSASANAGPEYHTVEQREALAKANRDSEQRMAETDARWKREAEAAAARDAEQRRLLAASAAENRRKAQELYDRNKAEQQLLTLTPAQAEQLSAHCPLMGYYIGLGQGIEGVAEPGAMYDSLGRSQPLLDLGLLGGNLDARIPLIRHLYQECSRESLYQGRGAWAAPWPITKE